MKEVKMFVGGQWVGAVSGEIFEDYNPFDGSVFAVMPKGGEEDAAKAVKA